MKTKDKVVLKLLFIILVLFVLWVIALVLWLSSYSNYLKLMDRITNLDMHICNEDLFKSGIIEEPVNYMAKDEKSIITDLCESGDKIYLGRFKITHYCACKKCCGPNAMGITASGKMVEENKTIAVDTKIIKMGSKVLIDGYGEYEAQDTGSAIKGNIIDVYVADHNKALKMGIVYKDVYLLKGE